MKAKWLVFIAEYLKDFNGSAAARRAGYKGRSNTIAQRLLSNVDIDAEIKRQIAERAMGPDEVLQRLAEMARGDLGDAIGSEMEVGDGIVNVIDRVNWGKLVAAGKTHLVKKFKMLKDGTVEIEFHDPQRALELLGKHHKLFTEKIEEDHSGKITLEVVYDDKVNRTP